MKISPRNRHIVVEKVEEKNKEERKTGILLPEDYKEKPKPYALVRIRDTAPDCTVSVGKGDVALVENSMIQKIEIQGETVYLVLENYIYGVISKR